jgi:hypothetical protein
VSAAAGVAKPPKDEQRKVVAKGPKAVKQAVKKKRVERKPTKLDNIRAEVVEKFSDGNWHWFENIATRIEAKQSVVIDAMQGLSDWQRKKRYGGKSFDYRLRTNEQREEPGEADPTPLIVESPTDAAAESTPPPVARVPDPIVTELPRAELVAADDPEKSAAVRKADNIAFDAVCYAANAGCLDLSAIIWAS